MDTSWIEKPVAEIDQKFVDTAEHRQKNLTKPPGSLGRLEDLAVRLCGMQKTLTPEINDVQIVVFAADHGIAEENVSAFPQAVTVEMLRNFSRGGAAISVLAKQLGALLEVVNVGTVSEHEDLPGCVVQRIAPGTQNFSRQAAMTITQLMASLDAGREAVQRAQKKSVQCFIGGDMGIANTTSATAIACVLLEKSATALAGPGTGLDEQGVSHKVQVIEKSIKQHKAVLHTPIDVLQTLGGFEIAALTGAYIYCAQKAIPVVVDGFISSVAALLAVKINPQVKDWLIFSHASAEPGHKIIMQALQAEPLLDLQMRLGEASGAAVVVPLLRLACALHNGMATFDQAGVSNKENI